MKIIWKNKFILITLLLCIIAILIWIFSPPRVKIISPVEHSMPFEVKSEATATASHIDFIVPKYTAKITEFKVKIGSMVKKGDVLAVLDTKSITEQIKILQEALHNVPSDSSSHSPAPSTNISHAQNLLEQGLITKKEFNKIIMANYNHAIRGTESLLSQDSSHIQARIAELEKLLAQPYILSEYTGRVSNIIQTDQKIAIAGKALIAIQQNSPVIINIFSPLKVDAKFAKIELQNGSENILGKIVSQNKIDENSEIIVASFDNPAGTIEIGKNYSISLNLPINMQVLTIPTKALHQQNGNYYIYILVDGEYVDIRPVTIGATKDNTTAIISGLSKEDKVINSKCEFKIGQKIRP